MEIEKSVSEIEKDEPLKIAVLGSKSVGKSSLISCLIKNKSNEIMKQEKDIEKYSTIINITGLNYKLNILDTIFVDNLGNYSNEDFDSIDSCEGYILVFSFDNKISFEYAKFLYKSILMMKDKNEYYTSIILVGNKIDLKNKNDFSQEVEKFCEENKNEITFIKTNALEGTNVHKAFELVSNTILLNRQSQRNKVEEEEYEEDENLENEFEKELEKFDKEKNLEDNKNKKEEKLENIKEEEAKNKHQDEEGDIVLLEGKNREKEEGDNKKEEKVTNKNEEEVDNKKEEEGKDENEENNVEGNEIEEENEEEGNENEENNVENNKIEKENEEKEGNDENEEKNIEGVKIEAETEKKEEGKKGETIKKEIINKEETKVKIYKEKKGEAKETKTEGNNRTEKKMGKKNGCKCW